MLNTNLKVGILHQRLLGLDIFAGEEHLQRRKCWGSPMLNTRRQVQRENYFNDTHLFG